MARGNWRYGPLHIHRGLGLGKPKH
jgi:hypothetical protein